MPTIVAGLIVAGLQIANQLVFSSSPQIRDVIAVLLTGFATVGVSALYGPQLVAVFHIGRQTLLYVGAVLSTITGVIAIVPMSTALHTVLATAASFVGALLFGTPAIVAAVKSTPRHRAAPRPAPAPPAPPKA